MLIDLHAVDVTHSQSNKCYKCEDQGKNDSKLNINTANTIS